MKKEFEEEGKKSKIDSRVQKIDKGRKKRKEKVKSEKKQEKIKDEIGKDNREAVE